jgi:hypothetical protein
MVSGRRPSYRGRVRALALMARQLLTPAAIYLAIFTAFTWPWMPHFSSEFFTDAGDGYQNVWNMWWVNHSVTVLHQLPWSTTSLHYPYGTSLLGQTMNPFNGLVAIALLPFMSLAQAFNTMIVVSFVATGVTGFWLCHYFCGRYVPALIGGGMITFSGYHLAKNLGLVQLVSLEWVPLFLLLWWRLLTESRHRPTGMAAGAAVVLTLVVLCDYYYFLFTVVGAAAIAVHLWRRRQIVTTRRTMVAFGVLATVLALPLPAALAISNIVDPMSGGHPSQSTDLLSFLIDGGNWRFAGLTDWYYGSARQGVVESTVYLSVTGVVLLAIGFARRRRIGSVTAFWLGWTAAALVLALGPDLVFHGHRTGVPLPFDLLRVALPFLEYNIEPARIVVMATISTAVVASIALSRMRRRVWWGLAVAVLAFELWPARPPSAPVERPPYVAVLATQPPGGVIDEATADKSEQLYDAVLDGHPLAFGYISRTPASVSGQDDRLEQAIERRAYPTLCGDGFRYVTSPADVTWPAPARLIYDGGGTLIYRIC